MFGNTLMLTNQNVMAFNSLAVSRAPPSLRKRILGMLRWRLRSFVFGC